MESSVVAVKRSRDENSWTGSDGQSRQQPEPEPEIEARVSERSVLIKIHCEKRKGFLVKVLAEVENLNLSVLNTSVTPFGDLALDITIVAEMDEEASLTG